MYGRDLQNRIKICFLVYSQPVPFGYRDRGEGTVTEYVTSTCCSYLNTHRTTQLFHVGHIIGVPSSNKFLAALLIDYLLVIICLNCEVLSFF